MKEIYAALAKAQSEFKTLKKNATANAGKFSYNYVTLDALIEMLRAPLAKHNLGFFQKVEKINEVTCVTTTVFHSSGESFDVSYPMTMNFKDMQQLGSVTTYARRYGLQSAFGVFAEEDNDAADVKHTPNQTATNQSTNVKKGPSNPQIKRLFAIAKKAGIDSNEVTEMVKTRFGVQSLHDLTRDQYDKVCAGLEQVSQPKQISEDDIPDPPF